MGVGMGFFWLAIVIVLIISPIGIWNRLIKIHQEERRHNKAVEDKLDEAVELLRYIAGDGEDGAPA